MPKYLVVHRFADDTLHLARLPLLRLLIPIPSPSQLGAILIRDSDMSDYLALASMILSAAVCVGGAERAFA